MANIQDKLPANTAGRYYVDESCIDCDLCRSSTPDIFRRHNASGYSYVHHQPNTPDELAKADEALENCPTASIGNDGAAVHPKRELSASH